MNLIFGRVYLVFGMVYFICTGDLPYEVNAFHMVQLSHMYQVCACSHSSFDPLDGQHITWKRSPHQMDRLFYKSAERLCETVTVDNYVKTVEALNKYDIEQGFDWVVPFGKDNIEELKRRDDFTDLSCAFKRVILGVTNNNTKAKSEA